MSLDCTSADMAMCIVAPRRERRKSPYVLDEAVPRTRNHQEVMNERLRQQIINTAKNKPDDERTFLDYLVLAQDKLSNMEAPVCYYA